MRIPMNKKMLHVIFDLLQYYPRESHRGPFRELSLSKEDANPDLIAAKYIHFLKILSEKLTRVEISPRRKKEPS